MYYHKVHCYSGMLKAEIKEICSPMYTKNQTDLPSTIAYVYMVETEMFRA